MAKYSKFNIVYLLQKWMDSVAGQTFMNYAYSWGAAVVILGTLFKLTHLPGANVMLFIGMGTEVFVFFISAFDRPFDKTQDGRDLATDTQLAAEAAAALAAASNGGAIPAGTAGSFSSADDVETPAVSGNVSGPIIINGGGIVGSAAPVASVASSSASAVPNAVQTGANLQEEDGGTVIIGADVMPNNAPITFASGSNVAASTGTSSASASIDAPQPSAIPGAPAPAVSAETAQAMEEATTTYVDRLNELNELLLKVGAQSERLTTDSEEMENLNRTLTGIARVYEMQLKSASQQITTQDEINEQTRKMAQQIQELNSIYARMIEAMSQK